MRLLLFLISLFFSLIFYSFSLLFKGKSLLWNEIKIPSITFNSISWNFLAESMIFLSIWIIFVLIFTPLSKDYKWYDKKTLYSSLLYLILFIPIFFWFFDFNKLILSIIIIFSFWDISFNIISNLKWLKDQKLKIRYMGLVLNYLTVILSIIYLNYSWNSFYILVILFYSMVFNLDLYKNYKNYISFLFSLILFVYLSYKFFLIIYDIYIYFIGY